jgi:rRNA processing protein Krr1/Pno1
MSDVNEYQKLLEPPTKSKFFVKGKQIDIICGQFNKSRYIKKWVVTRILNLNIPNLI